MNPKVAAILTTIAGLGLIVLSGGCKKAGASNSSSNPNSGSNPFPGAIYRAIDDSEIIKLVSNDELELRHQSENLICKYTKQGDTLRIVVNIFGTSQALYYKMTPEGLVDEHNHVLYEPAAYEKAARQAQLARDLIAASEAGDANRVGTLLESGASPSITDANGSTPLWLAIKSGNAKAVTNLLTHHADPNAAPRAGGYSPLMWAINPYPYGGANPAIVQTLIDNGAATNVQDSDGNTPLLLACIANNGVNIDIVKALLSSKANPNWKNRQGASPLYLLINYMPGDNAGAALHVEAVNLLLQNGADPNSGNFSTPLLYMAIEKRQPEYLQIAKLLLAHGANPNARNSDGWSMLIAGVYFHNLEVIPLLVAAGADKTLLDKNGHDLSWYYQKGDLTISAALRTVKEAEEDKVKAAQLSRLLIGTWREEHSEAIYSADGTFFRQWSYGRKQRGKWSLDGSVLTESDDNGTSERTNILELTATDLASGDPTGSPSRAKRIK